MFDAQTPPTLPLALALVPLMAWLPIARPSAWPCAWSARTRRRLRGQNVSVAAVYGRIVAGSGLDGRRRFPSDTLRIQCVLLQHDQQPAAGSASHWSACGMAARQGAGRCCCLRSSMRCSCGCNSLATRCCRISSNLDAALRAVDRRANPRRTTGDVSAGADEALSQGRTVTTIEANTMLDLLITNANLPDGRTGMSIAVRDGKNAEVVPHIEARAARPSTPAACC